MTDLIPGRWMFDGHRVDVSVGGDDELTLTWRCPDEDQPLSALACRLPYEDGGIAAPQGLCGLDWLWKDLAGSLDGSERDLWEAVLIAPRQHLGGHLWVATVDVMWRVCPAREMPVWRVAELVTAGLQVAA